MDCEVRCSVCGKLFVEEVEPNVEGWPEVGGGLFVDCPECGADGSENDMIVENFLE